MVGDTKENVCDGQRVYRIGGISVDFPYKAYGSQLAYMGKVVATLERSHRKISAGNNDEFSIKYNGARCHALLESPTGTGKSLALLCSTLAWLKHYKASSSHQHQAPQCPPQPPLTDAPHSTATFPLSAPNTGGGEFVSEDFSTGGGFLPETTEERPADRNKQAMKKRKHPTIFYATRTHSQITQVLREYRKTSYRVPMAVLAARKHYCTNKHVCKKANIDEECKLLLKDPERSCLQFKNFHKVKNHFSLRKGGSNEIHDIEDLVGIGNSVKGCAYFAARSMALDADIVFCPYGYLLNPVIRNAMEINLQGSIIILDEAHNIEDVAREAGSIDLETGMLEGVRMELEQLTTLGSPADFYNPLLDMVQEMLSWIYQKSSLLQKQDFEHYSSCWFGEAALQELELAGIHTQSFAMLSECAKKAIGAAADTESDNSHLSGFAAGVLEGLFSVLNFMLNENSKNLLDYRLVVQKYVKRDHALGVTGWVSSVSFWCLNPAVVFAEVASQAQSIILTSGTLSPLGSFASELGVPFEVCMEAPHVIDMKAQVWAASVSKGLGSVPLNASYKHADGYTFQDALGKALEEVFKVSPDGALVFFPSYKLLEKLCDRWKATGQWERLYKEKQLFIEPRGKVEVFETMLTDYYGVINGKQKAVPPKTKSRIGGRKVAEEKLKDIPIKRQSNSGAAFLAVCRGKVSEGMDFSDKNARVVIVVGIPFPNQKDMQVNMKKQYNTQNKASRNLLGGDQWYCYQAFRALNQAVGRCIRHRYDYGAIILMDERYKRASNLEYMSKWLRGSIHQVESLEHSLEGLRSFFEKFKDLSLQSLHANKSDVDDDLRTRSFSSNRTLPRSVSTAPPKQRASKKIIPSDDKENMYNGVLAQAVSTSRPKQRFLKQMHSVTPPSFTEKSYAPVCNDRTNDVPTGVQPTEAVCNIGSASKQLSSPVQQALRQTGENVYVEPADSISVITLSDSPTKDAGGSLLGCLGDGAIEESSDRRGPLVVEPWTPLASTVSISSEVSTSIMLNTSSNPFETSVSALHKRKIMTSCNFIDKKTEDAVGPVARYHETVSSPGLLVRRLTTDFSACKELSLPNGNNCVSMNPDYSLSANKNKKPSVQVESPSVKLETSIKCLKCGGSLLRDLQHDNLQKVRLKKKFLSKLLGSINPCRDCQPAEYTDVLVCEMEWLHPLIETGICNPHNMAGQSARSVWVEEDGCVFNPLFCPWCKHENCIGAFVPAANRTNRNIVEMALLLCDTLLMTTERGERCFQGIEGWEKEMSERRRCDTESLNLFIKRASQAQTPPRPKLKLPRRD